MDYLKDLECFFEDLKAGLKEVDANSLLAPNHELERMKRKVRVVNTRCTVLIEKLLDPRISQTLNSKIASLPIPQRTINALTAYHVITMADLLRLGVDEVMDIPGLGRKAIGDLQNVIRLNDVTWELLKPGVGWFEPGLK